ncbi:MAG TPA: mechanosensitive ion channel domain-containing protein, partial [Gaiellaceae bacterium]|nr:mechanosensitive ion channel domain-containing protein [Gaiellaceae bacterium]
MVFWHRVVIAAGIFIAVSLVARLIDWRLARAPLPPEAATRYRVLRRTVTVTILVVGFFSALLVIPQVRAVAGGLLASSAVLGVIIGFASQRTLGNFVAGILIALAQPVRLGDRVVYDGEEGIVEEIGLTYTFIRTQDRTRLVVPNEKLASDTILNSTIRGRETFAEITVQVPLSADVGAAVD